MPVRVTARAVFQLHIENITATTLSDLSVPISTAWDFDDAAGEIEIIDFPKGNTALARPAKASMLVLIFPPTNVSIPMLKAGVSGRPGIALSPNTGTVIALSPGSLLLTLTEPIAGVRVIWV